MEFAKRHKLRRPTREHSQECQDAEQASPDCRKAPSGRNAALHSRRRIHSRRRRCFTRDRQEMERPNASCRPPCGNGPTPNHPIIDPNGPPHCCLSSPIIIIIGLTSASTEDPLSQGSPSITYRDATASLRFVTMEETSALKRRKLPSSVWPTGVASRTRSRVSPKKAEVHISDF